MKLRTLTNATSALFMNPHVFFGRKSYIFLVSHMRSYSSLLCHILGSHREISGYSEMHMSYDGWVDLIRLRLKVYNANDNCLYGHYLLDKILHNRFTIADSVLNLSNVKIIVIIRNPSDTLKSIINMKLKLRVIADMHAALNYYEHRLDGIMKFIERSTGKEVLFFESERILDDTDLVLRYLSDWLEIEPKLIPTFSHFKFTGKPDHGDPSELIKKGRIVRDTISKNHIHIPSNTLNQAKDAYESCREFLLQHCQVI